MAKKKDDTVTQTNNSNVFPKKYIKALPSDFMDSVAAMKEEEIKAKIVESERGLSAVEAEMNRDPEIQQLKESLKLASIDYKEQIAEYTAKLRYCCWILEERGSAI